MSNFDLKDSDNRTDDETLVNSLLYRFVSFGFIERIGSVVLYGDKETDGIYSCVSSFLNEVLIKVKKADRSPLQTKQFINNVSVILNLIKIRQDKLSTIITYDNVLDYYVNVDMSVKLFLKNIIEMRIKDDIDFKKEVTEILKHVQLYEEISRSEKVLRRLDDVKTSAKSSEVSLITFASMLRATLLDSYHAFNNMNLLDDKFSDYMAFSDEFSSEQNSKNVLSFLGSHYQSFKTNYKLIDDNIGGIESATVTIISGPSNSGKSIFLLNIVKNLISMNTHLLKRTDVILFVTLEDEIHKLLRRIISVFGNYDAKAIKHVFEELSRITKKYQDDKSVTDNIRKLLTDLFNNSVTTVTKKSCTFMFKHSAEGTLTMDDINHFIDKLKLEGKRVVCLCVDYLDLLSTKGNTEGEYDKQGDIVNDMRACSMKYSIPVITITQNSKVSENVSQPLNNTLIGDSYKKIRFSDYVYMMRQRPELDIANEIVANDIFNSGSNSYVDNLSAVPMEIVITKAKDGNRGVGKYHLFCSKNLKIYDYVDEMVKDMKEIDSKTADLDRKVASVTKNKTNMSFTEVDEFSQYI